uniref:Uncharacterized protein n=1 Tax=Anopheles melas TaxID=34690 RepID=A0A2C9H4U7_9DIPT
MKLLFHILLIVLIVATCFICEAVSAPSDTVKREAAPDTCRFIHGMMYCTTGFFGLG